MGKIALEITDTDPKFYGGKRVNQGEVGAGSEPMGTILRSCVCVGFHSAARGFGAISHVTGFGEEGGHDPAGAVDAMARLLRKAGIEPEDCECFLIGGSERAKHVYDNTVAELRRRGIVWKELDKLGRHHRKVVYYPESGRLVLYKKSEADMAKEGRGAYSSDRSYQCFHDSRRRLITGASLFFRNEALLGHIQHTILPGLVNRIDRLHVWCAGCSNGMEVYSIAMVIADWLDRHGKKSLNFRMLGSDISAEALRTAVGGEYAMSERAVSRHVDLFNKYVTRLDSKTVRVNDALRRMVTFKQRDIRLGSRRHKFEFIVCDHVFQYFEPDVQDEFLTALISALQPGGYLFVSSPTPNVPNRLQRQGFECLARSLYRPKGAQ